MAAAALLAVAPVAAGVVPGASVNTTVQAADTQKPAINLEGGTVTQNATVSVTPSITLTGAIGKDGNITTGAVLSGNITASINGTTTSAALENAAQDITLKSISGYTTVYEAKEENGKVTITNNLNKWNTAFKVPYVKAGDQYTLTLDKVGFNFGSANANKTVTLTSTNSDFKFVDKDGNKVSSMPVNLNQFGIANGLKMVQTLTALNTTDTSDVTFYNKNTGTTESQGTYEVLADLSGKLNVNTLLKNITDKYGAHQYNGSYNNVAIKTTAADVIAELKKQNIDVDSNGNFTAPASFKVTLTSANSTINGKSGSFEVTVTVPNGKPVTPTEEKGETHTIMVNSKAYDKNGNYLGHMYYAYNNIDIVPKVEVINGKTYYKVANKDEYVRVTNITGTKRTLRHNAYIYWSSYRRTPCTGKYYKGQTVTTYGGQMRFKNGKRYYRIEGCRNNNKRYIKAVNFY